MALFHFSMEYQEEAEMLSILRTPDLELSVEDQHWLGALTVFGASSHTSNGKGG